MRPEPYLPPCEQPDHDLQMAPWMVLFAFLMYLGVLGVVVWGIVQAILWVNWWLL